MPWTPAQMKSIQARAHGWKGAGAFSGVSQAKARQMEGEGVRQPAKRKAAMGRVVKKRRRAGY